MAPEEKKTATWKHKPAVATPGISNLEDSFSMNIHELTGRESSSNSQSRTKKKRRMSFTSHNSNDVFDRNVLDMQITELLSRARPNHDLHSDKAQVTLLMVKDLIENLSDRGPLSVREK